jgi:hypothetical protein
MKNEQQTIVNRLTGAIIAGRTGLKPTLADLPKIFQYLREHEDDIIDEIKEIANHVATVTKSEKIHYLDLLVEIKRRYKPDAVISNGNH